MAVAKVMESRFTEHEPHRPMAGTTESTTETGDMRPVIRRDQMSYFARFGSSSNVRLLVVFFFDYHA